MTYETYSHYHISNLGRIKNTNNNNFILKPSKPDGYYVVTLYNLDKIYSRLIHILVALAFIPNPNKFNVVNHINGIKTDNRACNLEWTTNGGNMIHAFQTGLFKPAVKKVK